MAFNPKAYSPSLDLLEFDRRPGLVSAHLSGGMLMKRILFTILFLVGLLALAGMASLTLNGAPAAAVPGQSPDGAADAVQAVAPASEQQIDAAAAEASSAPAADPFVQRLNMIALPLHSQAMFAALGHTFNAKGLAAYIGPAVIRVQVWLPGSQTYRASVKPFTLNNFALQSGGVYMVTLDNSDQTLSVFTIVGDVPPPSQTTPQGTPGRVEYTLAGGSPCKLNQLTAPLDRPDLAKAKDLALAIGNVARIQQWNANTQVYQSSLSPFTLNNFDVRIGYPYMVCVNAPGNGQVWP